MTHNLRPSHAWRGRARWTACAILLVAGCSRGPADVTDDVGVIAVTTRPVRLATLRDVRTVSGTVAPLASGDFLVTATEPCEVAEVTKKEGDAVKAGEIIVRLDVPSISHDLATRQLEMGEATSQVDRAKTEAAKLEDLYKKGLAARLQWEASRDALAVAEATLTQVRARLESAKALEATQTIRARFSGVVSKRWHHPGEMVSGGDTDPILRIVDPTKLQIVAQVPVVDAARILVGQTATIQTLTGTEAATVSLKLTPTSPTETMMAVHLAFVAPTALPIDTVVQAEVAIEERKDVIAVPSEAVQSAGGGSFVWVANANNQAERRDVRIGLLVGNVAQIISGLTVGEQVIVTGIAELSEGTPITISKG
jgi:membrane fusion protein (multidrug efflux system)